MTYFVYFSVGRLSRTVGEKKTANGEKKAEKLYISAHSAVESQAFYKAIGCREAEEYRLKDREIRGKRGWFASRFRRQIFVCATVY